jgi:hypothetical protein
MDIWIAIVNTLLFMIGSLFFLVLITVVAAFILSIFMHEQVIQAIEILKSFKVVSWIFFLGGS